MPLAALAYLVGGLILLVFAKQIARFDTARRQLIDALLIINGLLRLLPSQ